MHWIKWMASRSVFAYAGVILICAGSTNFARAFEARGKYLLGIFFNGDFQNYKDGIVYFDYMRRHEPQVADHYVKLSYNYQKLGDTQNAEAMQQKARSMGEQ